MAIGIAKKRVVDGEALVLRRLLLQNNSLLLQVSAELVDVIANERDHETVGRGRPVSALAHADEGSESDPIEPTVGLREYERQTERRSIEGIRALEIVDVDEGDKGIVWQFGHWGDPSQGH